MCAVRTKKTREAAAVNAAQGLLFDAAQNGFVMYGVQGRTWVALGDPVAADDDIPELITKPLFRPLIHMDDSSLRIADDCRIWRKI